MKRKPEVIRDVFDYDPETGVLLRRFKGGNCRVVKSGHNPNYHTRVSVNGREYQAHRLIWFLAYGYFPTKFIDHINGNKSDNRLCNLRLATDAQNKRNVGPRSHNKSGFKGVSWDKENSKWMAHATLNGRGYNLGRFPTKEMAAKAYAEFAKANHGEFYRGEFKWT